MTKNKSEAYEQNRSKKEKHYHPNVIVLPCRNMNKKDFEEMIISEEEEPIPMFELFLDIVNAMHRYEESRQVQILLR